MKTFLIFILFLYSSSLVGQDLYLQLQSVEIKRDSLIQSIAPTQSFKNLSALQDNLKKIEEELQKKGFFDLRITEPQAINDSVLISQVTFNKKYNVIYIKNHKQLSGIFRDKKPFIDVENLNSFFEASLAYFSIKGKVFSQLQFADIELNHTDTVQANLQIKESSVRTLDSIVVRGYPKFPMSYLKNYAKLQLGQLLDKNKLTQKAERLQTLNFVKQIKSPQIQFSKDSTKLYLYVERNKANSFDGFIGFNNTEDNNLQLNGNINLVLVNNFHAGEQLLFNYRNDGNAQEWIDLGVHLPYLFHSPISLETGIGIFRQDSLFATNTQRLKLFYQIAQYFNVGVTAKFQTSNRLIEENMVDNTIADFNTQRYGLEATFRSPKRYNSLFLNNSTVSLSFGIGQRETSGLSQYQQYINLEARQIFKLHQRQYLYFGIHGGFLNSDTYLTNELYRFGGVHTMRGFAENRFFADLYGTLQTEYRYVLGSNLYVHSVLDYGFYQNDITRFFENLYSFGLGFGLETKAGVLRLIFANGGSDSQNIAFGNTQIHLKFLSIF